MVRRDSLLIIALILIIGMCSQSHAQPAAGADIPDGAGWSANGSTSKPVLVISGEQAMQWLRNRKQSSESAPAKGPTQQGGGGWFGAGSGNGKLWTPQTYSFGNAPTPGRSQTGKNISGGANSGGQLPAEATSPFTTELPSATKGAAKGFGASQAGDTSGSTGRLQTTPSLQLSPQKTTGTMQPLSPGFSGDNAAAQGPATAPRGLRTAPSGNSLFGVSGEPAAESTGFAPTVSRNPMVGGQLRLSPSGGEAHNGRGNGVTPVGTRQGIRTGAGARMMANPLSTNPAPAMFNRRGQSGGRGLQNLTPWAPTGAPPQTNISPAPGGRGTTTAGQSLKATGVPAAKAGDTGGASDTQQSGLQPNPWVTAGASVGQQRGTDTAGGAPRREGRPRAATQPMQGNSTADNVRPNPWVTTGSAAPQQQGQTAEAGGASSPSSVEANAGMQWQVIPQASEQETDRTADDRGDGELRLQQNPWVSAGAEKTTTTTTPSVQSGPQSPNTGRQFRQFRGASRPQSGMKRGPQTTTGTEPTLQSSSGGIWQRPSSPPRTGQRSTDGPGPAASPQQSESTETDPDAWWKAGTVPTGKSDTTDLQQKPEGEAGGR